MSIPCKNCICLPVCINRVDIQKLSNLDQQTNNVNDYFLVASSIYKYCNLAFPQTNSEDRKRYISRFKKIKKFFLIKKGLIDVQN